MKQFILLVLITTISRPTYANGDDWVKLGEKDRPETPNWEQQKMEPKPSSVVGGAESGEHKKGTVQERMRQDNEDQKQLYNHGNHYRRRP